MGTKPHRTALDSPRTVTFPAVPPLPEAACPEGRGGMELLLLRDLATVGSLVGLLALVLLFLDATPARP